MDGESYREEKHKEKIGDAESNPRNVLQSVRVRRSVRVNNEVDRVLLVLPFGLFLWIVFLVVTNI